VSSWINVKLPSVYRYKPIILNSSGSRARHTISIYSPFSFAFARKNFTFTKLKETLPSAVLEKVGILIFLTFLEINREYGWFKNSLIHWQVQFELEYWSRYCCIRRWNLCKYFIVMLHLEPLKNSVFIIVSVDIWKDKAYISSEQLSGRSIRYPDLRRWKSSVFPRPGYGVPPSVTSSQSKMPKDHLRYWIECMAS
jgi:hypothetical protein